eukprot:gene25046-32652_t
MLVQLVFILSSMWIYCVESYGGFDSGTPGCDTVAALQCEYEFLLCKLFNGPANDQTTLCNCAKVFFGECIRKAGCETSNEVGPLSKHEIYMKTCIDFIMSNNCPDALICSINCASDADVDRNAVKIIPFNNYGPTYLQLRICLFKIHSQRFERYATVEQVACTSDSDFVTCSRLISPNTFVPVALPIDTTYVEVQSCTQSYDQFNCVPFTPPSRFYGNKVLFPNSYNIPRTNTSVCASN